LRRSASSAASARPSVTSRASFPRFKGWCHTPIKKVNYTVEAARLGQNTGNDVLDRSVAELELSVRSYNCLKNANIRTIHDLVQRNEREMLARWTSSD
jgi:DNA-directed RNA polymerase alpha subunit